MTPPNLYDMLESGEGGKHNVTRKARSSPLPSPLEPMSFYVEKLDNGHPVTLTGPFETTEEAEQFIADCRVEETKLWNSIFGWRNPRDRKQLCYRVFEQLFN